MAALCAVAVAYLAVALSAAAEHEPQHPGAGVRGMMRDTAGVLRAGLLWPTAYWQTLKADWDRYFED